MLINDILITESIYNRTRAIDAEEFKKLLPSLQLALQKTEQGDKIYRGTSSNAPLIYTDPTLSERVSANTTNYYTLLIDNILPNWKGWPKRSRSLICTGDYSTAVGYSNSSSAYIVLPIGNPLVAVCPNRDFWYSFSDITSMASFNDTFVDFYHVLLTELEKNEISISLPGLDENTQSVVNALAAMDTVANKYPNVIAAAAQNHNLDSQRLVRALASGDSVNMVGKLLDPDRNGFKATPYAEYQSTEYEIWFSAPAVLMHPSTFDKLIN